MLPTRGKGVVTDPTCRDCKEPIQLLKNRKGNWEPFDFVFRSHWASCKKKRQKVDDPPAVLDLMDLEIKVTEARRLVKGLRGDDQAVVKAALKRRDEERRTA